MEQGNQSAGPQESSRQKREGVSVSVFMLSLLLTALLTGGGVFLWNEKMAQEARLILEQHIEDLRAQRDLVLGQRAGLQVALEALREEIGGLKGGEEDEVGEVGRPSPASAGLRSAGEE